MNFHQLKYIVAVDRHRNFAKAADECDVAQSTLSKQIQQLEKEFNILIFDRSRFPVTTTLKGADLIESAKEILQEQKEFIAIAGKMSNLPRGNYHLGILPMLAPYLLPLFVTPLSKNYPDLFVDVEELTSKEMITHFENGLIDAAITTSPFIKDGYYEEKLFEETFVLYLNSSHPLSGKSSVRWHDIPFDELILHEALKHSVLPSEKPGDKPKKIQAGIKNINYESGSLETIRKIIDRNGGVTLLPGLATLYMGERRLKMIRSITDPALTLKIILVTPRGFEKNRINKVIKKEIIKNLPVINF